MTSVSAADPGKITAQKSVNNQQPSPLNSMAETKATYEHK